MRSLLDKMFGVNLFSDIISDAFMKRHTLRQETKDILFKCWLYTYIESQYPEWCVAQISSHHITLTGRGAGGGALLRDC